MRIVPFKHSSNATIGIELEFQIINPITFSLISRSKEFLRKIKESPYNTQIKPEITQSMIEVNSSIHHSPNDLLQELLILQQFLIEQAHDLQVTFCGGGSHPFQKWSMQKIFPTFRYKRLAKKFSYLSKCATVFGLHIHVGCNTAEDALYLTHAFSRFAPQFIALSASSPFYQGVDTGFYSTRSGFFSVYPLGGVMPYFATWEIFSDYFNKLKKLSIVESMKDFYWDIRPKPELGTVEIRVCDTPLSIKKAVMITAYIQALTFYLLDEKPIHITPDLYYFYNINRFQASRYGLDAEFINPNTLQKQILADDILNTIKKIERYANQLNSIGYLSLLLDHVINKKTDTQWLRNIFKQVGSLPRVVEKQCKLWLETL